MFRFFFILVLLCTVPFIIGCSDDTHKKVDTTIVTNYETITVIFGNTEFEDTDAEKKLALESSFFTLTKLKSKRKFTEYKFSGDSVNNSKTINEIGKIIKKIKQGRDTINAIRVTFDDKTPIKFFVETHKILTKEKPECIANTIQEGTFGWYMSKPL
jgi:hypothetical protein